jgi:lambda family phage minor tail protein L
MVDLVRFPVLMSVTELYQLSPDTKVELYELDLNPLSVNLTHRFHAQTFVPTDLIFNGQTYQPYPIEAEGFELNGGGQLPTPRIKVSNIFGFASDLIQQYRGCVGAKLTRRLTFAKNLNTPTSPNNLLRDPDIWFVAGYSEDRLLVTFDLKSELDLRGVKLPKRLILKNVCQWKYKGTECSYTGTLATCDKSLQACEEHFGEGNPLPFGGFPGVDTFTR